MLCKIIFGHLGGLVLAGPFKRRTVVLGVYGVSGATSAIRSARLQQSLWEYISLLVELSHLLSHNICMLGDLNHGSERDPGGEVDHVDEAAMDHN